jgi:hypothetical protein
MTKQEIVCTYTHVKIVVLNSYTVGLGYLKQVAVNSKSQKTVGERRITQTQGLKLNHLLFTGSALSCNKV